MNLRQAAQQALEALERGETKLRWAAITALHAALAEPQTTHWEGCEAVHPDCGAAKAERKRIVDMLLDMHAKEERHNYYLFIANIIKESA